MATPIQIGAGITIGGGIFNNKYSKGARNGRRTKTTK